MKTSSFRCRRWASTPTRSSASISSFRWRTSSSCSTSLRGTSTARFALGKTGDAEFDRLPRDEIIGDRLGEARELLAYTRERWRYLLNHLDTPLAAARSELSRLGLTHLTGEFERRVVGRTAPSASSTFCRTTRSALRGRPKCERRCIASFPATHSRRCSPKRRQFTNACCAAACSSHCTCTRATATFIPTFPSTPTTT